VDERISFAYTVVCVRVKRYFYAFAFNAFTCILQVNTDPLPLLDESLELDVRNTGGKIEDFEGTQYLAFTDG
jgi:hypothetical protein